MKKFCYLAALAVIAAGCAKEAKTPAVEEFEETPEVVIEPSSVVFTAGIDTKAVLDGSDVKWVAGDAITIWNGSAAEEFTTTESGASATFTTTATFASAASYVALYPADAGAAFSASGVSTTLPAAQTAAAGTFDPAANLAVASSTNTSLTFYNLVSYLKFTVPAGMDDLTSVSFSGNAGQKVAGAATVNVGTKVLTATGSDTATLSGPFAAGSTYYLAIAPQTFIGGYTVTITRTSGTYTMVSSKDVTFSRTTARNIGNLWDGTVVMEGASSEELEQVDNSITDESLRQTVFTYRGLFSAGILKLRLGGTSIYVANDITIPAAGNYHVMYNASSKRIRVYSQDMYVDFVRGGAYGAATSPWKILRNTDPDTVDDTCPNYTLLDYDQNLTGVRCDLSDFPRTDAYKYKGTGDSGNDAKGISFFTDDFEITRPAWVDGLFINHVSGEDSEVKQIVLTGLTAGALYDFRIISLRFNATPSARLTELTLVGTSTYGPKRVYPGMSDRSTSAQASYDFVANHLVEFNNVEPDGENKVTIKVQGIDTGTRADANINAMIVSKVVYSQN